MKPVERAMDLFGRGSMMVAAVVSFYWSWRIWVGLQRWESHFKKPIPDDLLWRYFASPLLPLIVAGAILTLLASNRPRRFRRLFGGLGLVVMGLPLLTPDGFAHDMGHCMLNDCSEEFGTIHLVRCGSVAALCFLGLVLTGFADGNREQRTSPNSVPGRPFGNSGAGGGAPSVS